MPGKRDCLRFRAFGGRQRLRRIRLLWTSRGSPGSGFDSDMLAARIVDREFESWFGGALPTCGIAGVTVAAEYRGRAC